VSRNRRKHKEFNHGLSAILSAVASAEVEASATAEWTRRKAAWRRRRVRVQPFYVGPRRYTRMNTDFCREEAQETKNY
jgi:hypothetical protein